MSGIGHNGPPSDEEDLLNRDGWIAVARAMRSHWLVGFGKNVEPCDPDLDFVYSRSEAWLDLIMECRYFAGTVNNNGRKMRLEPGQLIGATSWLGSRWNWSPKQVRTFLDKLEEEGMITRYLPGTRPCSEESQGRTLNGRQDGGSKGRFANVLTVSKYAIYQLAHREKWQVERQVEGQVEGGLSAGYRQVEGHIYKDNKGTREQGNQETKKTSPPQQEAARGGGDDLEFASLNGSAFDIIKFIGKSVNVAEPEARRMLKTNIQAYGSPAILDAFSITLGKSKTEPIADPYHFFLGCARNAKEKAAKAAAKPKTPSRWG